MNVRLGPYNFDHVSYGEDRDVRYLSIGEPREAADSDETPEGHIVRYDAQEQIIGLTLVNAKWPLDRDGTLSITFPERAAVANADELQTALVA